MADVESLVTNSLPGVTQLLRALAEGQIVAHGGGGASMRAVTLGPIIAVVVSALTGVCVGGSHSEGYGNDDLEHLQRAGGEVR